MKNLSKIIDKLDVVTKEYVDNAAATKVDKVDGKQLSTNDFSTKDKNKLDSLNNYTLPKASADVLGGIKIGTGLTINEAGVVNVEPNAVVIPFKEIYTLEETSEYLTKMRSCFDKDYNLITPLYVKLSMSPKQCLFLPCYGTSVSLDIFTFIISGDSIIQIVLKLNTHQLTALTDSQSSPETKSNTQEQLVGNLESFPLNEFLTYDDIPTAGSTNLVNSNNIKKYVDENAGSIPYIAQPEAPTDTEVFWVDTDDNTLSGGAGSSGGGDITVDTQMSDSSTNAVQNKVIKKYVDDQVVTKGNMNKSVYDTNSNGVVDNAEKLGNQLPNYYASKEYVDNNHSTLYYKATAENMEALQLELIPIMQKVYDNGKKQIIKSFLLETPNIPESTNSFYWISSISPTQMLLDGHIIDLTSQENSGVSTVYYFVESIEATIENEKVTQTWVSSYPCESIIKYLDTQSNPTTPFEPVNPGDPATKKYVDEHAGGNITIDSAMSDSSTNPVQNKVIKKYVDDHSGGGSGANLDNYYTKDQTKEHFVYYQTDTEGRVTDANKWTKLGYALTSNSTTHLPELCSGPKDKWGVLQFVPENIPRVAGTQLFFPIDGTYKGRVFTRGFANNTPGPWCLINTDIPDTAMSDTSEKPVQNKIIKKYVDDQVTTKGDMLKSTYDTNGNGIVDNAEKLGNQLPNYYASKQYVDDSIPTPTIVDATMSDSSINPVQNKITKKYTDDKIKYGTAELTPGSSALTTGSIYVVYE